MNKKKYEKPILISEDFVPQEYVASCDGPLCGTGLKPGRYIVYTNNYGSLAYDRGHDIVISDKLRVRGQKWWCDEHLDDDDDFATSKLCMAQRLNTKGDPHGSPIEVTYWKDDDENHDEHIVAGHYQTAKS